jgi:hypothetical protein
MGEMDTNDTAWVETFSEERHLQTYGWQQEKY